MKILLTGGGTAGHIYPIMALAENLKKKNQIELLYLGSRQGPERKIAQNAQIPFKGLIVGKWRNYFSLANFWDLIKIIIGLAQSFFILTSFKPNVVFAKGGYVTFPILFWAKLLKIPVVIHESDSVMGRANRWAAKFAKKVCVGFPLEYYQGENLNKFVFTGVPVRQEFFEILPQPANITPVLLVTGGSQGAHPINNLLREILDQLLDKYQVYHLCGQRDFEDFKKSKFIANQNYHLEPFSEHIVALMAKADLIIARAGATTFAEIGALKKASILIPYAEATANHQAKNANIYKSSGAAIVLNEKDLKGTDLLSIINQAIGDINLRHFLGQRAEQFGAKDAGEKVINAIIESAEVNNARK